MTSMRIHTSAHTSAHTGAHTRSRSNPHISLGRVSPEVKRTRRTASVSSCNGRPRPRWELGRREAHL